MKVTALTWMLGLTLSILEQPEEATSFGITEAAARLLLGVPELQVVPTLHRQVVPTLPLVVSMVVAKVPALGEVDLVELALVMVVEAENETHQKRCSS